MPWYYRIIVLCVLLTLACAPQKQAERNIMKVYFERSGGFAGMRMTATINSETLSSEEVRRLDDMVDTVGFFNLPSVIKAKTPGADRFQYKITVETEKQKHTVEVDEAAISPTLRSLIEWLTAAARKKMGSQ